MEFLAEMELLLRKTDHDDRRVIHLSLTDEGRVIAEKAQAIQSDCMQELLAGMSDDQIEQLRALWEIILSNGERLAKESR